MDTFFNNSENNNYCSETIIKSFRYSNIKMNL